MVSLASSPNVPPPATVTAAVSLIAAPPDALSVPALIATVAKPVFAPLRVSVPVPFFVRFSKLVMLLASVVLPVPSTTNASVPVPPSITPVTLAPVIRFSVSAPSPRLIPPLVVDAALRLTMSAKLPLVVMAAVLPLIVPLFVIVMAPPEFRTPVATPVIMPLLTNDPPRPARTPATVARAPVLVAEIVPLLVAESATPIASMPALIAAIEPLFEMVVETPLATKPTPARIVPRLLSVPPATDVAYMPQAPGSWIAVISPVERFVAMPPPAKAMPLPLVVAVIDP